MKISNLSVNKLRKILQKPSSTQIFQLTVRPVNETEEVSELPPEISILCEIYSARFRDDLPSGLPPERPVNYYIEIEENSKPPYRPLFQLPPADLEATKMYIADLLNKEKIRPSKSPFGSPLFFVKEKEGKLRGVVDYRALNRTRKKNRAPLPPTDEMFDRLAGAKSFSKLDLKTGFHQIRMHPGDVEKTAFNTKYRTFEYLVMPMGLCNAPSLFQTLMNNIFYDCVDDFLVVYMDDLLIYSKSYEEHIRQIETVLRRLQENNLFVSLKKCEFAKKQREFLGLIIDESGIQVDHDKIKIVQE